MAKLNVASSVNILPLLKIPVSPALEADTIPLANEALTELSKNLYIYPGASVAPIDCALGSVGTCLKI